jgi:hypothetical protein
MILYPFCYDHAKAAVGGEMAFKKGAVAYSDFIDTRSQMIFWIYGFSTFLFGHHEWALRAFDILYQIASLLIFYIVLRRFLKSEGVAFLSVIIYSLLYVTGGIDNTALVETFAFLPSIMVLYLTERSLEENHALKFGVYSGLFAGILFLLKFTFLIVSISAVLYVAMNPLLTRRNTFRFCMGHVASVVFFALLYFLYIYWSGALPRFLESLAWLRHYSNAGYVPALNPALQPSGYGNHKIFPSGFLLTFGITFTVLLCIAIFLIAQNRKTFPRLYSHLFIQLFLGLLMIYYENKSFGYHFTRLYFAAVPLISFGAIACYLLIHDTLLLDWSRLAFFQKILRYGALVGVIMLALFYTPLIRIDNSIHLTSDLLRGKNSFQYIQDHTPDYYYKDIRAVAYTLGPILKPQEDIFVWGESVGIYFYLQRLPTTICLGSIGLSDPSYTPKSWREKVLYALEQYSPAYIIVQLPENSYTAATMFTPGLDENRPLEVWPELNSFVRSHYTQRWAFQHFQILEKNK